MDDDWEFPLLIGATQPYIIALKDKIQSFIDNQDHGYSNDPKDIFVDFTDDELRAIAACLGHAAYMSHSAAYQTIIDVDDVDFDASRSKITDIMERNDIFL